MEKNILRRGLVFHISMATTNGNNIVLFYLIRLTVIVLYIYTKNSSLEFDFNYSSIQFPSNRWTGGSFR